MRSKPYVTISNHSPAVAPSHDSRHGDALSVAPEIGGSCRRIGSRRLSLGPEPGWMAVRHARRRRGGIEALTPIAVCLILRTEGPRKGSRHEGASALRALVGSRLFDWLAERRPSGQTGNACRAPGEAARLGEGQGWNDLRLSSPGGVNGRRGNSVSQAPRVNGDSVRVETGSGRRAARSPHHRRARGATVPTRRATGAGVREVSEREAFPDTAGTPAPRNSRISGSLTHEVRRVRTGHRRPGTRQRDDQGSRREMVTIGADLPYGPTYICNPFIDIL